MLPSWTNPLLVRMTILVTGCLVIVGGVWLVSSLMGQSQENPAPIAKEKNGSVESQQYRLQKEKLLAAQNAVKAAAEAKAAKEESKGEAAPVKETKLVTLAEAINYFEKTGKGEVIKAEKTGDGSSIQFALEVLAEGGARGRYTVSAAGKTVQVADSTPTSTEKKGKKKGRR
jgi:hypothetical protein